MENLSAALVGLMRSSFQLWSQDQAGPGTDALAVECTRMRAEFEQALATYLGSRGSSAAEQSSPAWDQAAETSVGDAPIVLSLEEARVVFETFYVMGALTLFKGQPSAAAKALAVDQSVVKRYLEQVRGKTTMANRELWSTICALAQAGVDGAKS